MRPVHPLLRFSLFLVLLVSGPSLAATQSVVLGMGCFWGAEMRMAKLPGVVDVEAGYAGGDAETVDYRQVLETARAIRRGETDATGHAEVVKVSFDTDKTSLEQVLAGFWENHDPTQGNRQGNDIGSNYRSAIFFASDRQKQIAEATREVYQQALSAEGFGKITTEIAPLRNYNSAETYHQDYLKKNPNGYCGLGGTGVPYPGGLTASTAASADRLDAADLQFDRQLIVFEAEDCPFCKEFERDILSNWPSAIPVITTRHPRPPQGWTLEKPLFGTPTIVLFEEGRETARYTGYQGEPQPFIDWLSAHE
ncbi:MAG: peptide-methionine (S)-S-oxide reductase MsrA [Halothiobacillaceae bacterium]|nr:peptide-methionine (S)-S-oxide reductase MsrA [Halothiobacillaceae bacterium]